jgi:enoyl-CoA hydratase/carnithine racemase
MSQPSLDVDPALLVAGHLRMGVDGSVLTVTLDRPEARNAQTPSTWRALAAIGQALDDQIRVVVLRSEGESFSAGLDRAMFGPGLPGEPGLMELAQLAPAELDATIASFQRGFSWLADDRVVSIAAVQGHAVGAGFQLALACDLRIVAEDARFAMRETSLGLVPDLTGTGPLVRAIGYARALEVCVTGRWIDAQEAVRTGLALLQVQRDDLGAAVQDLVGALTAADAGAVRETKALLRGAQDRSNVDQHAAERAAQARRLAALAGSTAR